MTPYQFLISRKLILEIPTTQAGAEALLPLLGKGVSCPKLEEQRRRAQHGPLLKRRPVGHPYVQKMLRICVRDRSWNLPSQRRDLKFSQLLLLKVRRGHGIQYETPEERFPPSLRAAIQHHERHFKDEWDRVYKELGGQLERLPELFDQTSETTWRLRCDPDIEVVPELGVKGEHRFMINSIWDPTYVSKHDGTTDWDLPIKTHLMYKPDERDRVYYYTLAYKGLRVERISHKRHRRPLLAAMRWALREAGEKRDLGPLREGRLR